MRRVLMVGTLVLLAPFLAACPSKPKASGPITISVAGPISISVTAPSEVRAGDLVKLTVKLNSAHGRPQWTGNIWGDGVERGLILMEGPCFGLSPPYPKVHVSALRSGKSVLLFTHRYRRPGDYHVSIEADEFMICATPSPSATARLTIHVGGPIAPGNGVADPEPAVGIHAYKNGFVTGYVGGSDVDGYIHSATATWPDGTTHEYVNTQPCKEETGGWPNDQASFPFKIRLKPGLYRITAIVTSTDCSGHFPETFTVIRYFRLFPSGWSNGGPPNVYLPHEPSGNGESFSPTNQTS